MTLPDSGGHGVGRLALVDFHWRRSPAPAAKYQLHHSKSIAERMCADLADAEFSARHNRYENQRRSG
jgi:hypothetical protein